MVQFEEMGTGLFLIVLCMNLFLIAFGGQPTPSNLTGLIPDGNVSVSTVTNPTGSINTSSYSVPTQTQLSNENDPFSATINFFTKNNYSAIQTLLFGITIFAIKLGMPQAFLFAIIIPVNVIMLFYLADYIISHSPLRGIFGK